jgi:hypothetical protein
MTDTNVTELRPSPRGEGKNRGTRPAHYAPAGIGPSAKRAASARYALSPDGRYDRGADRHGARDAAGTSKSGKAV